MKDKSILIRNIFHMLAYHYLPLAQDGYRDVSKEDFAHIHNLFAAILARGMARQVKRGLLREYVETKENLPVLRGKIDMPATISGLVAQKLLMVCEFDEMSRNCLFNRIVKSAMLLLLRHGDVDHAHKLALKKTLPHLARVETVELARVAWQRLRFHRHNHEYRLLVDLCRLLAEGLILTTEDGAHRLASFLKPAEMHRLFEKFVLAYYSKEFPGLLPAARAIPWMVDDQRSDLLPAMRSDVVLEDKKARRMMIIDTKYYDKVLQSHYQTQSLRSAHLYQIFAYVKNMAAAYAGHAISGMVLYARTDEEFPPDNTYSLGGNRIIFRTLDLNRDFAQIRAQLDEIARLV